MVNIIPANNRRTFGERLNEGVGRGVEALGNIAQYQQLQNQKKLRAEALNKLGLGNLENLDPELQKVYLTEKLRGEGKANILAQKQSLLNEIFGGGSGGGQGISDQMNGMPQSQQEDMQSPGMQSERMTNQSMQGRQGFNPMNLGDAQIAKLTAMDPQLGNSVRAMKDTAMREARGEMEFNQRQDLAENKFKQDRFERDRAYHTQFSKEAEKEAEGLRNSIPRQEMALNLARDSIETGDLSFFSPDKLADATGIDLFRTAKGAQLITAGKENLLGNMSRTSARAQNQWFEQKLNSMFPKIGQDKEANLTIQEMLEGEAAMNKAYLQDFDRLAKEDVEKYGFVKKDVNKRARDSSNARDKDILKRTTYRMKEIEEQEKGLSSLKNQVGKNVIKNTPLTLAMAKLYKEKFGDKAIAVAKQNGYYIPTVEEFKTFQARPEEFREEL